MTLEEVTTLKEAIKRLKEVIKDVRSTIQPFLYDNEAKDYILKALEQEPCEDAVSRQAVLDIIEKEEFKGDALSEIEKLPSVKPQKAGHWIIEKGGAE